MRAVLVVAESALILKRIGWGEGFAAAFKHGKSDYYRNAMLHVASIPLSGLLEDPRAEVFSWDRVGAAAVSRRRLTLTLDGTSRRVRVKRHATAGDLLGSLREHLGERLGVT